MNTIYFATLTTVDNIFACNHAEAPFGCFALFFVDQMPVLCLRNLCTMLHFVDSARCCFEIKDYSGLIIRKKQGLGKPAVITLNYPADARLIMKEDDADVG